jgi:hypothetical protein
MRKKIVKLLFTVSMLFFVLPLQAQDWRATTPYQCAFDDATENAIWILINSTDLGGRVVYKEQVTCQEDCTKRLDVSGLAPGAYFVHIVGPDAKNVQRLIVK